MGLRGIVGQIQCKVLATVFVIRVVIEMTSKGLEVVDAEAFKTLALAPPPAVSFLRRSVGFPEIEIDLITKVILGSVDAT